MTVFDLDGNSSNWCLKGHVAKARLSNKSQYHLRARELLAGLFPTLQILEEVPIKTRKSETLYLDFYLPLMKKCVEVHGEQHYKFIGFYHHTMMDFFRSQKRDNEKKEWCDINGISHITLPYNEDITEWRQKISND
jgi:hypothetical protein